MSNAERSFDDFWNSVVLRAIDFCIKGIDSNFFTQASVQTRKISEYKDELEGMYKRKRNWLKFEYLPEENEPYLDFHKLSSVLCRCVVGSKFFSFDTSTAELMLAERKANPQIAHKDQIAWEISNVYVNYKLAFLIAEGIAFEDLRYWAQRRINRDNKELEKFIGIENLAELPPEDQERKHQIEQRLPFTEAFQKKLTQETKLRRYICGDTHDDFVSSLIVSLMKTDCLRRDFDYLSFSAIMFQWQEYTKVCIFTELIEDSIRSGKSGNMNALLSLCLK